VRLIVLQAYIELVRFDAYLIRGNFGALYRRVRASRLLGRSAVSLTPDSICSVVDRACVFYVKEVLCLQRSAATTCLLRRHGVPAELVIGAQHTPFRAHAWVEVDGRVINDKPYVPDIYAVVDRC
jgi:hypothetical protein